MTSGTPTSKSPTLHPALQSVIVRISALDRPALGRRANDMATLIARLPTDELRAFLPALAQANEDYARNVYRMATTIDPMLPSRLKSTCARNIVSALLREEPVNDLAAAAQQVAQSSQAAS